MHDDSKTRQVDSEELFKKFMYIMCDKESEKTYRLKNIASDLSVEELTDLVKLNRTTLQRVFKQMYGVTIFEYRTRIRMQEAKNLLLDDTLTITEISGMCGYTNASKFSAAFKKNFGITPKEWRRSTDYREEM